MKCLFIYLIILLILNQYYYYTFAIELPINVDFNSKISYKDYECGASLKKIIDKDYNIIGWDNSISYPPCLSIEDAGIRARKYFEDYFVSQDIILIIVINSFNWRNDNIKSNIKFGDLKYYCGFEIIIKDEPNAILTIDGTNINDTFINFYNHNQDSFACNPITSLTRIKLKNINFINFNNQTVFNFISYSYDNPLINIEFTNINTINTNKFIVSEKFYKFSQIKFILNNCKFSNFKDNTLLFSANPLVINQCIFENIELKNYYKPLIFTSLSLLEIYNTQFNNITSNSVIISQQDYNLILNNLTISNCTLYSSTFLLSIYSNTIISKSNNSISNLHFQNNQIFNNGSLFYLKSNLYNNGNLDITFNNITFENNNKSLYENEFIYGISINSITFLNFKFSNQFSTIINSNSTIINIDNTSSILLLSGDDVKQQQQTFCIGNNNIINYKSEIPIDFKSFIENNQSCINCKYNYLLDDDHKSTSNGSNHGEAIDQITSESSLTSTSSNQLKNQHKFKKILILPIVFSILVLISLSISIIFRKNIKNKFIKKDRNIGDDGVNENAVIKMNNLQHVDDEINDTDGARPEYI